jgi:enolase
MKISKIHGRQIIDSRATPTIEVEITLEDGSFGRASVPSGASTGIHEALELRDGDKEHYDGKSVLKAVENVENLIAKEFIGKDFEDQRDLDNALLELDETENKSKLGANAILAVSLAFAHATAASKKVPLFKHINDLYGNPKMVTPRPMFNIMNGGRHANWATDIQEFIIIVDKDSFSEQLETASEIFTALGKILAEDGLDTDVGNEGGYAPGFKSNEQAFEYIIRAIDRAGFQAGKDVFLGMDIAASEFYDDEKKLYTLKTENAVLNKDQWFNKIYSWIQKYPIISIEDPFSQDDWGMWQKLTPTLTPELQIVGDDLLVTNVERVKKAIEMNACNSLLVKVNQIGTLTETLDAMKLSEEAKWTNVVSHRSGETEDVTIAHIAVGTGCGQIKTGAPSRGERTAKYNELLRIEEQLG